MVGIIDKIKHQYEMWKIEKYTKRRSFLPEYDSRDKEYYERHYHDGVYYAPDTVLPPPPSRANNTSPIKQLHRAPSIATKRASTLLRGGQGKKAPSVLPRCSETYNASM
ncbi:hypothetical protein VTP01DRAFT_8007 [Rhizomucor pusillus]|uniref:uncharacterized protein n=1 Tax=Rhizomucor pusillus TaxID=4840 RepID=UPI003743A424